MKIIRVSAKRDDNRLPDNKYVFSKKDAGAARSAFLKEGYHRYELTTENLTLESQTKEGIGKFLNENC